VRVFVALIVIRGWLCSSKCSARNDTKERPRISGRNAGLRVKPPRADGGGEVDAVDSNFVTPVIIRSFLSALFFLLSSNLRSEGSGISNYKLSQEEIRLLQNHGDEDD
jgi:hypothetical protein